MRLRAEQTAPVSVHADDESLVELTAVHRADVVVDEQGFQGTDESKAGFLEDVLHGPVLTKTRSGQGRPPRGCDKSCTSDGHSVVSSAMLPILARCPCSSTVCSTQLLSSHAVAAQSARRHDLQACSGM